MDAYREIAEYYDTEHDPFQLDIEFYLNAIERGPVLELGAGTGRVAQSLAGAGIEVWAVEPSEAMLARARHRLDGLENVHLIQSSAQELQLSMRFPVVLLSLNTLWHLPTQDAQMEVLRVARAHLDAGGLLFVDLSNPLAMPDRGSAGELRQVFRGRTGDRTVTRSVATWDDEAEQVLELSITYDIASPDALRQVATEMSLRYVYRWELEAMLQLAGLRVRQVYGSYDLDPYDRDSDRLIAVAERYDAPTLARESARSIASRSSGVNE